jgi:hypothetical protein
MKKPLVKMLHTRHIVNGGMMTILAEVIVKIKIWAEELAKEILTAGRNQMLVPAQLLDATG